MANKKIEALLKRSSRPAWKPELGKGDGAATDSKFGGTPWLAKASDWPKCEKCGEPTQLFLQLNLESLPKELSLPWKKGLLQLFMCTRTDDLGCDFYRGEAMVTDEREYPLIHRKNLIRVVEPKGAPAMVELLEDSFPGQRITGWKKFDDAPKLMELALRSLIPDANDPDTFAEEYGEDPEEYEQELVPKGGDKLGGWSAWEQGVEFDENIPCPKCAEQVEEPEDLEKILPNLTQLQVFQFGSDQGVPFTFPTDDGTAFLLLSWCKEHRHAFWELRWQGG